MKISPLNAALGSLCFMVVLGCGGGGACFHWYPEAVPSVVTVAPGGHAQVVIAYHSNYSIDVTPDIIYGKGSEPDPGIHLYIDAISSDHGLLNLSVDETVPRGKSHTYYMTLKENNRTFYGCSNSDEFTFTVNIPE